MSRVYQFVSQLPSSARSSSDVPHAPFSSAYHSINHFQLASRSSIRLWRTYWSLLLFLWIAFSNTKVPKCAQHLKINKREQRKTYPAKPTMFNNVLKTQFSPWKIDGHSNLKKKQTKKPIPQPIFKGWSSQRDGFEVLRYRFCTRLFRMKSFKWQFHTSHPQGDPMQSTRQKTQHTFLNYYYFF